jgi:LmbE family N-acetylglucosaminyl deacetylase
MTNRPTLLCVHAHPDDESLFTGGITSHYAQLGYRNVLVTCTNGQFGIDDHNRGGAEPGHNALVTRATRAMELQYAGALVGFERQVTLGFSDSGMNGWPQNDLEDAFVNGDVDATARVIADLIDEEGASVVVTYDENGYYGHPDHVMANTVTRRAVAMSTSAQRLFYPVTPHGVMSEFLRQARAAGTFLPAWIEHAVADIADDAVDVVMAVSSYSARKQQAIALHASQTDNRDLVTMDPTMFELLFGTEYYQLAWRRDQAALFGGDLFEGLW